MGAELGEGKLLPAHVVVIGARSYEPAEAELLAAHQVRVMTMEEVLDLDGLDPLDAPGTGTPVESGIRLADAVHVLAGIGLDPDFVAMELAESGSR